MDYKEALERAAYAREDARTLLDRVHAAQAERVTRGKVARIVEMYEDAEDLLRDTTVPSEALASALNDQLAADGERLTVSATTIRAWRRANL